MRHIKSLMIFIMASCTLAACGASSLGTAPDSQSQALTTTSPEFIDIDRRLSELESMKPGLMRLISIEADIKSLITELNTLADNYSGSPDGTPATQQSDEDEIEYLSVSDLMGRTAPEGDTPETKAPEAPPVTVVDASPPQEEAQTSQSPPPQTSQQTPPRRATGTPSDFAVHLTSYNDSRNLVTGWSMQKQRYPALLSTLTPRIEWISTASGESFLRLKAGPFATRAEADQTCRAIRARDAYCAVMAYTGSNIEDFIVQ